MSRSRLSWLCLPLLAIASRAGASEVCDLPPRYGVGAAAQAIVRSACNEHRLWQRPFIDRNGRVASLSLTEAESANLADHGLIAWRRVAGYWRDGGALTAMASIDGASSCYESVGSRVTDNDCRAFLSDNPWSAAFVSWVMTQAGLSGFTRSPRHIDYIRAAYHDGDSGPYRFTDPSVEKPAPGDLLCLLRGRDHVLGYAGLRAALDSDAARHWESHCDIVIAANVGGDQTLYLIGGNVLNTVMLRKLPLDRSGRLTLPTALADNEGAGNDCSPANEAACDFNRRDWATLLKLREAASISAPPSAPPVSPAAAPRTPMPPGFPRVVPPRPTSAASSSE